MLYYLTDNNAVRIQRKCKLTVHNVTFPCVSSTFLPRDARSAKRGIAIVRRPSVRNIDLTWAHVELVWNGARQHHGYWLLLMTIRTFHSCQNQRPRMTLKGHYAPRFKTRASSGAHHQNLNEGRPILSATDSRFWQYKVCAYICRRPGTGRQTTAGWSKTLIFNAFGRYVFGTLGNEPEILIWPPKLEQWSFH